MRHTRLALISGLSFLVITGCGLFGGGGQAGAPPPPEEAVQSLPTVTPTLPPPPPATPTPTIGRAGPGEILFVREGQLYAILPDGTGERRLTMFAEGVVIRDLTISPDGHYAAFTADGQQLMIYDLTIGQIVTVDQIQSGGVSGPVWSPGSDVVYYQKIALDPSGIILPVASVWQAAMPPGSPAAPLGAATSEEGVGLAPQFALSIGQLILSEVRGGGPGRSLLYQGSLTPLAAAGDDTDYGVWDVAPSLTMAAVFDLNDPAALFVAGLSATEGLSDVTRISPADDAGVFTNARFSPDGASIVALRTVEVESGPFSSRTDVVLFRADADGEYQMTVLGPDEMVTAVEINWHGSAGVVVQRLSTDNVFMLWYLPLDGSAGRPLTQGEQPAVVGGR